MKTYLLIILFISGIITTSNAQILDVAPNGRENIRAVEGGGQKVQIDTITPLNDLINKFKEPWQFAETGKMYWIGYTDDMYSIAHYKNKAILPLTDFIDTCHNKNARIGAIYTLHLIGINSSVAGRFTEDFLNKQARNAMLNLLKYDDLGPVIMELLVRDPWQSDIPKLFLMMEINKSSCWYIVNGFLSYGVADIPIAQDIPDDIGKKAFNFSYSDVNTLERNFDFEAQTQEILHAIKSLNEQQIDVDSDLFGKELWGNRRFKIDGQWLNNKWSTTVSNFLNQFVSSNSTLTRMMNYGGIGNGIQYYMNDGKLYICSPAKAKERLTTWWNRQPMAYKEQFKTDKAKSFR